MGRLPAAHLWRVRCPVALRVRRGDRGKPGAERIMERERPSHAGWQVLSPSRLVQASGLRGEYPEPRSGRPCDGAEPGGRMSAPTENDATNECPTCGQEVPDLMLDLMLRDLTVEDGVLKMKFAPHAGVKNLIMSFQQT